MEELKISEKTPVTTGGKKIVEKEIIIIMKKALDPRDYIDRLYVLRKEEERGLGSVQVCVVVLTKGL